jgi:hypothetical protein
MLFKNSISKKNLVFLKNPTLERTMLRIRTRRIHMFLGLLDPDPLFRGMGASDPDPFIIKQKQ